MKDKIQTLFDDTKLAFLKSDIKKFAEANNLQWNYSISATPLTKNNTVIVGFNWGASSEGDIPQLAPPTRNFKSLYDELGSFKKVDSSLRKYFSDTEIDNCVQTNFCFFRSKEENQISDKDLELSTPLFETLISLIEPKRIISFSSKLRDYFLKDEKLYRPNGELNITSNKKTLYVAKGFYLLKGNEIPVYFLPHPNSKFTGEARKKAWEFCFGNP